MGSSSSPLISCVMPTRDRRRFAGQAIRYFLRQDYAARELIVLDDGHDAIEDLLPRGDDRLRYVRLDGYHSIAAKRNLGCRLARGSLIAHWDDDDWYAPDRLSRQVAELIAHDAQVCGAGELLHYGLAQGAAWLLAPENDGPWLAPGTLVYDRRLWQRRPFDESQSMDGAYARWLPPDGCHATADSSYYLAVLHTANTAARNLSDPRWRPRPLGEATRRLGGDRDFYIQMRYRSAAGPSGRRRSR